MGGIIQCLLRVKDKRKSVRMHARASARNRTQTGARRNYRLKLGTKEKPLRRVRMHRTIKNGQRQKEPSYGIIKESHRREFLCQEDTDISRNMKRKYWR